MEIFKLETLSLAVGILSIIVGIIIASIPYFRSKYILRPELTVDVNYIDGKSSPIGLSNRNDFSKGYTIADTAIRIFELTWRFEITITNNSDQIALYPELISDPNGPKFTQIDNINILTPIKPAESLTLEAKYKKYEESTGSERTYISEVGPDELKDLNILLSYKNLKKRSFFTLFDNNLPDNKNNFLKRRPKGFC